jgi:hypothetical protein
MIQTTQHAAQAALDVQDACNLSGVVRSFVEAIDAIRRDPAFTGTDFVNQHPIAQLFASKIEDLTRVNYDTMTFSKAYDACKALAASSQVQS